MKIAGFVFLHTSSMPLGFDRGDRAAGPTSESLRNFYGFGFVLWESDMAERGRGNEKREKDRDENLPRVTKQLCSDQVTGMEPTNSVKNIE